MRRLLLAGTAALALSMASVANAQAPLPTGPGIAVFDLTAAVNILRSIGIESAQLDQLVLTVQEIYAVYQEAAGIYQSVAQLVHPEAWAPGLTQLYAINPMPFQASAQAGWVGGFNDPSSLPFGSQYMTANTIGGEPSIYQDGTFVGGELLKAVRAISTIQAIASNGALSIEYRITGLIQLFNQLANMGTLQQTAALQARLAAEANYAHSQQIQSHNLSAAAQQQLAVLQYNQRQWQYQDEANGIAYACRSLAASSTPLNIPECYRASTAPSTTPAASTLAGTTPGS